MTEAITVAAKTRTTKPATSFGLPHYEIPKFDLPKMEMPVEFREIAEHGVAQARDAYEKAKATTDEVTDLLKNTYATATKGIADYHLKVIETTRTNTNTAFDCIQEMWGVKSPSELVELSTSHARQQFETMTAQTKELAQLAQKVTTDVAEPLRIGVTKAFNQKLA